MRGTEQSEHTNEHVSQTTQMYTQGGVFFCATSCYLNRMEWLGGNVYNASSGMFLEVMIDHLFSVANIPIKASLINLKDQECYDHHPLLAIVACSLIYFPRTLVCTPNALTFVARTMPW